MVEIASVVLYAADFEATVAFYRAVGLPLEDEDHGDGPVHAAIELGDVHFAIYPAENASPDSGSAVGHAVPHRAAGSVFPGFYVDSLDAVTQALTGSIVRDHEQMPWGCRVLVLDPDRRTIEINQREHCPA